MNAGGGARLTTNEVPDWSGLWVWNSNRGFLFDPDTPEGVVTTAKLTPEYQRKLDEEIARIDKGIEYHPISSCAPPGFPRWLAIPFLREFIVTPEHLALQRNSEQRPSHLHLMAAMHLPRTISTRCLRATHWLLEQSDAHDPHQSAQSRRLSARKPRSAIKSRP